MQGATSGPGRARPAARAGEPARAASRLGRRPPNGRGSRRDASASGGPSVAWWAVAGRGGGSVVEVVGAGDRGLRGGGGGAAGTGAGPDGSADDAEAVVAVVAVRGRRDGDH